jgi:hypothetical protein
VSVCVELRVYVGQTGACILRSEECVCWAPGCPVLEQPDCGICIHRGWTPLATQVFPSVLFTYGSGGGVAQSPSYETN